MGPYLITCVCIILWDAIYPIVVCQNHSLDELRGRVVADLIRSAYGSGTYTRFLSYDTGNCIGAIWFLPALFVASIIAQLFRYYIHDNQMQLVAGMACYIVSVISAPHIWLPMSVQSAGMAVPLM